MSALALTQADLAADPDSLATLLQLLSESDLTDDVLLEYMAPLDRVRLGVLMRRLASVESAAKPQQVKRKQWEGRRSRIKGQVYERIVRTLLQGVWGVRPISNVVSNTNELDILVMVGPLALIVPPLKWWGPSFICECKYHSGNVKAEWIDKLHGVLNKHNTEVGLLFSKKGLARTSPLRTGIQIYAGHQPPRVMLCFSWDDIDYCANGGNVLQLFNARFVEFKGDLRTQLLLNC